MAVPLSSRNVPLCSPTPGAILDITLIANVQSLSHSDFFLSCVMGERDVSYLQIERENKIVMTHPKTGFQNYRNRSNHVQARGFSMADLVGILYCLGRTPTEQAQVVYVHNSHNGEWLGGGGQPPACQLDLHGSYLPCALQSGTSWHGGGTAVTHGLGLGSASTGGVERGGMFSWRSAAKPQGGVRRQAAARAAGWAGNGAWEQGKVQEEVGRPWRKQWGLEIINQSRGQPIGAVPALCPCHRLPRRR